MTEFQALVASGSMWMELPLLLGPIKICRAHTTLHRQPGSMHAGSKTRRQPHGKTARQADRETGVRNTHPFVGRTTVFSNVLEEVLPKVIRYLG